MSERYDAFSIRGLHEVPGGSVIRFFDPSVAHAIVREVDTGALHPMQSLQPEGNFERFFPGYGRFEYRLLIDGSRGRREIYDPYSFGPILGDLDTHLIAEGAHRRLWEVLGANRRTVDGADGVAFTVWAPNAKRVSVVGDFNDWDGRVHPMRFRIECGVWEIFIPGIADGSRYKFELEGPDGRLQPLKADPLAHFSELRPRNASILATSSSHQWHDGGWMAARQARDARRLPMSTYEVHLGSWRRGPDGQFLSYDQLADMLIPYVKAMGFTHLELMPLTEHPYDASWGYQATGMFAPTSRFGAPDDFRAFVDRAHREGIGVVLDWVPGHFPTDAFGLMRFDGTALYEYADPRKGFQPDWNTLIYNFSRREVQNFLTASALYWLEEFHVDGFRVDAVASMLYLSFSRKPGEWEPNRFGGPENLEAVDFIRRFNELTHAAFPGIDTVAEESTSWPRVSAPVYLGGLGFGFKWNMGWMHDMLAYFKEDPIYRKLHHEQLTFGITYAWTENFVLPLSHDEVVHGKGSLLRKMPGDRWQQFANLRLLFALMYAYPGKKLLFMGAEFAQWNEWAYFRALDWHLLDDPAHSAVQRLVRDLNAVYRSTPALYEADHLPEGFGWIDHRDRDQSVVSFLRRDAAGRTGIIAVLNATPVVRREYRIGAPPGAWREVIDTDLDIYGGSGLSNGTVQTERVPMHGFPDSLVLTLPPLGALLLVPA